MEEAVPVEDFLQNFHIDGRLQFARLDVRQNRDAGSLTGVFRARRIKTFVSRNTAFSDMASP